MLREAHAVAEIGALEHKALRASVRIEDAGARIDDRRAVFAREVDADAFAFFDGKALALNGDFEVERCAN